MILPVVSYGCEIWSRAPRKDRRLKTSENTVPKRTLAPNRQDVTDERENYIAKIVAICTIQPTLLLIKSGIRWAGSVARIEKVSSSYTILIG